MMVNAYREMIKEEDWLSEETKAAAIEKLDNIKLVALQNQDFNAKLLSTEGFVKGLDKDTNYVLYLYQGTEYKDIMMLNLYLKINQNV